MSLETLSALLADAVIDAERDSPAVHPVVAWHGARARRRQRRGHVAVLAFVVFAVVLQAHPHPAFGESALDHASITAMERPPDVAAGPGLRIRG